MCTNLLASYWFCCISGWTSRKFPCFSLSAGKNAGFRVVPAGAAITPGSARSRRSSAETGGQNAMIVDASPLAEQVVTDVPDLCLRQHRTLWRRRPLWHRPQSRRPPLPAPLRHRAHPLDRHHRCRRQGPPPLIAGGELAGDRFGGSAGRRPRPARRGRALVHHRYRQWDEREDASLNEARDIVERLRAFMRRIPGLRLVGVLNLESRRQRRG
jgi:hypothetical protein